MRMTPRPDGYAFQQCSLISPLTTKIAGAPLHSLIIRRGAGWKFRFAMQNFSLLTNDKTYARDKLSSSRITALTNYCIFNGHNTAQTTAFIFAPPEVDDDA